tara:strand:+ start:1035 stop:1712 length:678 start_codon:yes stop_codon:yes gene_type:complete
VTNIADVSVKILETPRQVAKKMGKALVAELGQRMLVSARASVYDIRQQAATFLMNSEVSQIMESDMRGQLGLTAAKASSAVNGIIAGITNSIMYTHKPLKLSGTNLSGGVSIHVQPEDFTNIFTSVGVNSQIKYYSTYYNKVVQLDWLNWILMRGDAIIVTDGQYMQMAGEGRSGVGKMVRTSSVNIWKVPSQISGTAFDNIITRTLRTNSFLSLVRLSIQKHMK